MGKLFRAIVVLTGLFMACSSAAEQEPVEVAIIGRFAKGPLGSPVRVNSVQFEALYGSSTPTVWPAELQARRFFANQGPALHVIRANPSGSLRAALEGEAGAMTGRHALPLVRDFGILICPELTLLPTAELSSALTTWRDAMRERRAMLILDPPPGLTTSTVIQWKNSYIPPASKSLVLYYPYLTAAINGSATTFGASGSVAAAWLKNDSASNRGIWTTPTGTHLPLVADSLSTNLASFEQDQLNQASIAVMIRHNNAVFPYGGRHLDGGDSENRYISVQRTLDWIGTNVTRLGSISASRSNDSALWSDLRINTGTFLQELYQRGAFQGTTPAQAYFVQCGLGQTMTQADVDAHKAKLLLGVALVRPAEFVILTFTWDTRNPAQALPAPRLLMRDGYSGKQLFYSTPAGATYALKSSPSLAAGSWLEHAAPVTGDGTWRRSEFQPVFGRRFFRSEQTTLP